jgi:hypothetical protein
MIIAGAIALEGIHGLLAVIVVSVIGIAALAFGLSNHGH